MKAVCVLLLATAAVVAQTPAAPPPKAPPATHSNTLLEVRRVYVAQLTGGPQAEALRDLIINSLNNSKLFMVTDNEERADAILKGAADDQAFTDSFDSDQSINSRENGGKTGSVYAKTGGLYGGLGAGDNESHHIKERKHEAYASVRLCNRDGDVLWSTTQESDGAKFRGASADVAAKIARQLGLDIDRARRAGSSGDSK